MWLEHWKGITNCTVSASFKTFEKYSWCLASRSSKCCCWTSSHKVWL